MTRTHDLFLDGIKSAFIQWLMQHNFYSTLALLQQCQVSLSESLPAPACIAVRVNQPPQIILNKRFAQIASPKVRNMAMFHEIRHLIQMSFKSEAYLCVNYPEWCTTDTEKRIVWKIVDNRAMDIALHEDFPPLFGNGFKAEFDIPIREFYNEKVLVGLAKAPEKPEDVGIQVRKPEWKDRMDFVYYAQQIIDELDQEDPQGSGGASEGGFDQHEIGPANGEDDGEGNTSEGARSWLERIVKRAAQEGLIMSKHAGQGHGDSEIFLGRDKLNNQIIDFINKIKITANRIAQGQTAYKYTYGRMNKLWPEQGLPGKTSTTEYTAGCFFIADISGSMCSPEILNRLLPALDLLSRKKAIVAAYGCDVDLVPLSNKVEGGGGTEMSGRHVDELKKLHGIKPNAKIDIIYCTDGFVDLTEITARIDVMLHVVLIPEGID